MAGFMKARNHLQLEVNAIFERALIQGPLIG